MGKKDYEISIEEKKFINYLKKYYLGIRVNFINNEIKRNSELQNFKEEESYNIDVDSFNGEWIQQIENKHVHKILINLPKNQKAVVTGVIFENVPLSEIAKKIGISKQLAYSYKKKFIDSVKDGLITRNMS